MSCRRLAEQETNHSSSELPPTGNVDVDVLCGVRISLLVCGHKPPQARPRRGTGGRGERGGEGAVRAIPDDLTRSGRPCLDLDTHQGCPPLAQSPRGGHQTVPPPFKRRRRTTNSPKPTPLTSGIPMPTNQLFPSALSAISSTVDHSIVAGAAMASGAGMFTRGSEMHPAGVPWTNLEGFVRSCTKIHLRDRAS